MGPSPGRVTGPSHGRSLFRCVTDYGTGDGPGGGYNPYANLPGHPRARGTLPMARRLTDLGTEDEIQALAAEAGLPTADQAARLARLLRLNRRPR